MKFLKRKPPSGKVFLVFNPTAGMAFSRVSLTTIKTYFAGNKIPYEVYFTKRQDSIRQLIRTKIDEGFRFFLAAGGDGTVSLLADALAGTNIPLAIIPTGTGNLLARELQVPMSIIKALQLAFSGNPRIKTIDGMCLNENRIYFLNISVGVSSELMQDTSQQEKRLFGRLGYIAKFIKLSLKLLSTTLEFTFCDEHHTIRSTEAILSNGNILALPPFRWPEHSELNDGRISFHVLRAYTIWDVVRFAFSVSPISQQADQTIKYYADIEDEIRISTKQALKVQADGDFAGYTPIHVKLVRHACKIIVPPKRELS